MAPSDYFLFSHLKNYRGNRYEVEERDDPCSGGVFLAPETKRSTEKASMTCQSVGLNVLSYQDHMLRNKGKLDLKAFIFTLRLTTF